MLTGKVYISALFSFKIFASCTRSSISSTTHFHHSVCHSAQFYHSVLSLSSVLPLGSITQFSSITRFHHSVPSLGSTTQLLIKDGATIRNTSKMSAFNILSELRSTILAYLENRDEVREEHNEAANMIVKLYCVSQIHAHVTVTLRVMLEEIFELALEGTPSTIAKDSLKKRLKELLWLL
jgi:hypothetical protein